MAEDRIPRPAHVKVWAGEVLLAETTRAVATALPESTGRLLIPEADVRLDRMPEGVAARADGFVAFDPKRVRIAMEDRWPGGNDPTRATTNSYPRWGDIADLERLMDLQPAGEPGLFAAPAYYDIRRNVVEGSQLLAQAIVAASKSSPGQRAISAHMIFSRPCAFDKPLAFRVQDKRRGRSFSTLAVDAEQDGKVSSSALVLLDKGAPDLIRGQAEMPKVAGPQEATFYDYGLLGRDARFVDDGYSRDINHVGPPEIYCWVRHREAPKALYLQQAMLAQFTGHMTIAAAMRPHKGIGESRAHADISTGVLAITIALHEEPDLTQWLLYCNPAIYAGRGLVQAEGRVFAQDGRLAASYNVQAMVREFPKNPDAFGSTTTRM
jgi:acyl-CoA thioesterase II